MRFSSSRRCCGARVGVESFGLESDGPMREGVDYAYGWRPGFGAELAAAGKSFVCRYLSGGGSKDLSGAELADLFAAGLDVVLVFETDGRTGPLQGMGGGYRDASVAISQAESLGAPRGTCIYFAVDFDAEAQPSIRPALYAYFSEATVRCHAAGFRCGVYGGLAAVTWDASAVDLIWQTYAWSGGDWALDAALEQYLNGASVNGVIVDDDRCVAGDFGQWSPHEVHGMLLQRGDGEIWLLYGDRYVHVPSPADVTALMAAGAKQGGPISDDLHNELLAAYARPAGTVSLTGSGTLS